MIEDIGFVKTVADSSIPQGYCVVMLNGDILYIGQLGSAMTPFITSGVFLILNPADRADGDAFMKKQIN